MRKFLSYISSKEAYYTLAILTLGLISLHLILHYVLKLPSEISDLPLLLTIIGAGIPLITELIKKILVLRFDADFLAGISIITALVLGEFLAAAIIILMLSGGNALETFAYKRASNILGVIAKRMPHIAHKQIDGKIIDTPHEEIQIGDTLTILPHEICPVDGTVIEGKGLMDESFLTGEPFHIRKTIGSNVISGAINGEDVLTIRADKPTKDSRYNQVMKVMLEAEQRNVPMKRLSQTLASYFTPLVLFMAFMTWFFTGSASRFLSVLIIATPCPLLIAISVVLMGTISLAARRGIIVKNPSILEELSHCKAIIFDKTGTLTYGKPELPEIYPAPHITSDELLKITASIERYSKHPLASGIVKKADNKGFHLETPDNIKEEPGKGLTGYIKGQKIHITGRKAFLKSNPQDASCLPSEVPGLECIILINEKYSGAMQFQDKVRTEANNFISHLSPCHQIESTLIVSGDRESEVRYLAEKVGIQEIHFSKSPEEKVRIVESVSRKYKTLFVGDGINDAPALAAASIGIAFGQTNEILIEAADAVILDSDLKKLDELFHLGQRMRKIALQSAAGGMMLSFVGMLVAAAGLLNPVSCAVSQEIIDLLAVLNALRSVSMPSLLSDYQSGMVLDSRVL